MGLTVGEFAPHFTLKDQHGNDFNSKDFIGKKSLVLFFYPKDYTPGCTKEACEFRDSYQDFTDQGAEVIGISADSESSHHKFATSYSLPFILLADTHNKVRKLFKVEKALFKLLPGRETYVLDKSGKVRMAFHSINYSRHKDKALKALKELS